MAMRTAVLLLALASVVGALELTKETWEAKTAGKQVFVKFFAPWCGHCKSMKPSWDALMEEYKDHKTVVIADVDCIGDGKDMCETIGVQGFPTIKHGDPNNLEEYDGGRDLASLQKFAKESLGPRCGPANLDLCDADKKKQIEGFMKMSSDALQKSIADKEELLAAADKEQEELLKSLQAQYEASQKKTKETKELIKESGLGLMKSVFAHKKKDKNEL